jgi:hypothetical protein
LAKEKVRIPAKKKGQAQTVLQCAAPEDVENYEEDQVGGPDKANILIAWHQPLTSASKWNTDAIILLAEKAQVSLGEHNIEYDSSWLLLSELVKQITKSLKETKNIMHPSSTDASNASATAYRARRRSRKAAVSGVFWLVWCQ